MKQLCLHRSRAGTRGRASAPTPEALSLNQHKWTLDGLGQVLGCIAGAVRPLSPHCKAPRANVLEQPLLEQGGVQCVTPGSFPARPLRYSVSGAGAPRCPARPGRELPRLRPRGPGLAATSWPRETEPRSPGAASQPLPRFGGSGSCPTSSPLISEVGQGPQGWQDCSIGCRISVRGSFSVRDVETSLFLGYLGCCAFPPVPQP